MVALDQGRPKLVLAAVLIFITGPVGSHLVGRAAHRAEGVEMLLDADDHLADLLDDVDPDDVDPDHDDDLDTRG